MSIHKERAFEDGICEYLAAHGWLHAEGDAALYDRRRALFVPDLLAWVHESQPDAWSALQAKGVTPAMLADRLRTALDKFGLLHVLRDGLDVVGLKKSMAVARFRPALAMNAELAAQHAANRLRVVRQVRYSLHGEHSLDLVLFLNGIPVATAELKSDYTQSVGDAVDQYRYDRMPKAPGKSNPEPILSFPGGAFVHFAVSNSEVRMTTRLAGAETKFLPFNRGHDMGAGNPPNPHGAATAYLWEDVWSREGWLEVLGRYVAPVKNKAGKLEDWLFPRYHQLDVTRRLLEAVQRDGVGGRYLVQHSAGSGKTNSIAWTAHFLADLHDADNRKLIHTVLVVSDRTVLDEGLREAIEALERTKGVVAAIKGDSGSKSAELTGALAGTKKVVVCTIQTFPFALEEVRRLSATEGKRFAVIADEAHSSQAGKAASELKAVLGAQALADLADGGEVDIEDVLAAKMAGRASQDAGISYFAFTATPKAKTMELFGTRPDPTIPAGAGNLPQPFHVYSMRQAIEEGFILDVLRNYTSWKMAFHLTHNGTEMSDQEVDASEARKGIMGWVRLHPVNIAARVQMVVEHFRQNVAHLLGGQAKAMVVTASRKEAVRWMRAMERYVRDKGYPIGLVVAFSGDVTDPESGPGPFTEGNMNPGLLGRTIREAFRTEEYSILLVANKFQTGFDQPLLCAMYVDRKLGGIQAVQTLSRLNRAYPGKDTTYVVDFVNEPEDILEAFKQYYSVAELTGVSDPTVILDLKNKLDASGFYDQFEVERVAEVVIIPHVRQARLDVAIGPVSSRLLISYKEAQARFRAEPEGSRAHGDAKAAMDALQLLKRDLGAYVRMYEFLGQMFDYGNTYYEKLHLFARMLVPLLDYGRERDGVDLSALVLTHHRMRDLGQQRLNLLGDEKVLGLQPVSDAGSGEVQDRQKLRLQEILRAINDLFDGEVSEGDAVSYVDGVLKAKLMESTTLKDQAAANTEEQFRNSPSLRDELTGAILDAMAAHKEMSRQALGSETVRDRILGLLLGPGELWQGLRAAGGQGSNEGADARAA